MIAVAIYRFARFSTNQCASCPLPRCVRFVTIEGMDSSHLKPEQIEAMVRVFGRHLRYLNNLCARMQKLRFPDDDPLCREAQTARAAAQRVFDAARFSGQK